LEIHFAATGEKARAGVSGDDFFIAALLDMAKAIREQ
jgi:hypothetical protein